MYLRVRHYRIWYVKFRQRLHHETDSIRLFYMKRHFRARSKSDARKDKQLGQNVHNRTLYNR